MNDTKKRRELTEKDRYVIEKCLNQCQSNASIAKLLGVSAKTIMREIHQGMIEQKDSLLRVYLVYSAYYAHERHKASVSRRGRKPSHGKHVELIGHIRDKLRQKWSPDAIIGSLRLEGK